MSRQRLEQIAFGFCVVLLLFNCSIAACICDHSEKPGSHCELQVAANHSHDAENSHHKTEQKTLHDSHSTESFSIETSSEECCCVQSAPKVFAKSETVKVEKQTADYQPNAPPNVVSFASIEIVETIHYTKPFYLSDSFYNIKSPRAPPRF